MKDYSINDLIGDKITGEWGEELTETSGTKILRTTNFTNEGRLNFGSVVERKIKPEIIEKKKLLPGDIIVEKSGGSPNQPVGRVVYFDVQNEVFLCNNFTAVLRPSNKVYPKYLFYTLFYFHLTDRTLRYQNKTTGILNLKLERYLNEERISLPSFDTQQKIAHILSDADKARQLRRTANILTDQFLQSTFLSMFGDPMGNPKGWEVDNIGNLIEFMTSGSRGWAKYYSEKGDVFLRINNIGYSELRTEDLIYVNTPDTAEAKRTLVREGDVLFSITADLARTAVIPKGFPRAYINQHLALLRLNKKKILPIFFTNFFATESGRSQIVNKGGVKLGLNFDDIKNLKVYLPPIKLQQQFADIVAETEKLRQRQRAHEQELEQLFKGLLQKYFG